MDNAEKKARIGSLNDDLRCRHIGGQVFVTAGINALGNVAVAHILEAVARFNNFGPDNDPYGERDCAVLTVEGRRIIWKIDYYDLAMEFGSEDPSDPSKTCRVLTVMLAEEY